MHTIETLREALSDIQSTTPNVQARTFPSSFSPHNATPAFPRSLAWHWRSAADAIRRMSAKGVMMRLPLFLQLEAPLANAAHEAGAFIFVNDADNMPLGAAAIMQAEIGCIVTTGHDGDAFAAYLIKKDIPAPGWHLVRHFEEDNWNVPQSVAETGSRVTQEVHLFPGLPIFVQCEDLAAERRPRFHVADDLSFEGVGDGISINSSETEPFSFSGLVVPHARNDGMCPCGKQVFTRT